MTSGLARPHEDLQGLEKARLDIAARKRVAVSKSGEETQNLTKELTLTTRRGETVTSHPSPNPHLARSHGRPQVSGTRVHGLYRTPAFRFLLTPMAMPGGRRAAEPSGGRRGREDSVGPMAAGASGDETSHVSVRGEESLRPSPDSSYLGLGKLQSRKRELDVEHFFPRDPLTHAHKHGRTNRYTDIMFVLTLRQNIVKQIKKLKG